MLGQIRRHIAKKNEEAILIIFVSFYSLPLV